MSFPLAMNHKQVSNQVWEKSKLDSLGLANGSAEAKYKIVDEDIDKFLKPSQLGQVVRGFKSAMPKLSDR